jgi:hypothetical protein
MAILYVGASTPWTSTAASSSFTINLPGGTLQDGDLMIAVLSWTTGALHSDLTCTPPSGWTKAAADEAFRQDADGYDHQLAVMTRTYASGDPSTWTGTLSASTAKVKVSGTVAYRGVQGILARGMSSADINSTSYNTATVNNTVANSWGVAAAGYESASLSADIKIDVYTSRLLGGATNSGDNDNVQLRISDSNGPIAVTSTSRTVSRTLAWDASCAWIGILQESTGTPATGPMAATLGSLTTVAAGEVHDDATMAATLSSVTADWQGYGQPPVSTGAMASTLSPISMDWTAATDVRGSMAVSVLPTVEIHGETRVFGVRVIAVEADTSRRIVIESRGVAD